MSVDFESQVVERSRHVPVVVDFWAAWCGPCRILGPILDGLAAAAAGRWELVKLDTDEQPEIAERYGVRGIPAVKLFRDGAVTAEFVGALPAEQVRRWLDQHLPDPQADVLAALVSGWERRRHAEWLADLERFVERNPGLAAARVRLAQALAPVDPARARTLLDGVTIGDGAEEVEDVGALIELMQSTGEPTALHPHLEAARRALRDHDADAFLEHAVRAVVADRHFSDELPRRAAVAMLRLLGHDHEISRAHLPALSMALHA